MVSHGLGGNSSNHHLLAQSLVQAGFIVAAVGHPDDLLRLGSPEHMVMRPLELKAGLDAVLLDNGFKAQIDPDCIGIFGYSLGGFTALAAAGGRASFSQIVKHCATSRNDLAFCIGNKAANALPIYRPPRVHLDQDLYDPRFKALVLAAPVGAPFEDLDRVKLPAFLVRAGADKTLRAPYHAEKIHRLLPQPHRYEVIEGLRHYAFLSPFPEDIINEVGPPAQDPIGFDRAAFLAFENTEFIEFFQQTLGVGSRR
jgi:predicted dienelactone hydrolase